MNKHSEVEEAKTDNIKPSKEDPRKKQNILIAVRSFLEERYDFRYNVFAQKSEYKRKSEAKNKFIFFDERAYHNMITDIKMVAGLNIAENDFRALVGSDKMAEEFDPIKDYLFSLPKWDREPRFERFLQQIQLIDENNRPHLHKTFKKWFVMMVASLVDDYIINDTCLVFSGKQGRGKTRFLESLVPKDLRFNYLYVGTFNPHDKDHKEMNGSKILIVLDEMETLTRTDQGTLKSTMSDKKVEVRRAYGHVPIKLIRRASFAGSINYDEFLTDTTGNRRWLPFAIHNIDVDESFDIGLLFAEALALFKEGHSTYFDRQEIMELEKFNEQFRRPSPEEELILVNFRNPDQIDFDRNSVDYMTSTDIMHDLASRDEYKKMNTNDSVAVRLGRVMSRLGFKQRTKILPGKDYGIKVWEVVKLNREEGKKVRNDEEAKELF